MPQFIVRTLNSTMAATAEPIEATSPDAALATGIRGATAMVSEEIAQGGTASAVIVSVTDAGERPLLRVAVSLSVASLAPD